MSQSSPNAIRVTSVASTIPPITKVQGGRDALRAAYLQGSNLDINAKEELDRTRSFVEKISAVFAKKTAAGNEQNYVDQLNAERAAAAQEEKAATEQKPQESSVSYGNNLKPSWVAQTQNPQGTVDQGRSI